MDDGLMVEDGWVDGACMARMGGVGQLDLAGVFARRLRQLS